MNKNYNSISYTKITLLRVKRPNVSILQIVENMQNINNLIV